MNVLKCSSTNFGLMFAIVVTVSCCFYLNESFARGKFVFCRMTCHKYMLLYKKKLSEKKISDRVLKEIEKYEEILDVLNITIWRKQAEIEVMKFSLQPIQGCCKYSLRNKTSIPTLVLTCFK